MQLANSEHAGQEFKPRCRKVPMFYGLFFSCCSLHLTADDALFTDRNAPGLLFFFFGCFLQQQTNKNNNNKQTNKTTTKNNNNKIKQKPNPPKTK